MQRDWKSLPVELLRSILSRLFFEDATSFSCVCKDWKSAASEFYLSPCPMDCPKPSQWLMFSNLRNTTFNFFNPLYNVFYQCDIPELSGAIIRYAKDGWLLMSKGDYSVFFFNPFTRERIDLPDLAVGTSFDGMCFSSAPTSPECMVFMAFSEEPNITTMHSVWHGEEGWTRDECENDEEFHSSPCHSIFHNGKFYFLGRDGRLGKCDPEQEEELWQVLDKPPPISEKLVGESYLMEYDGQLLSLFVESNGEKVSLYKLDESTMTWKRIKNLGDNMLFVSNCSSFLVKKKTDGMENRIYFPRFCNEDGIFYSLETNKFESFYGNFSSNSFLHTQEKLHCCWIEPNFDRAKEGHQWIAKPSS